MSEDNRKSIFNAGVALAERIDGLRRAINAAKYNPTAFNPEVGKFNFEIMVTSADNLLDEAWGKLTDKERLEGDKYSKLINQQLLVKPIIIGIGSKDPKINKDNLQKFLVLFTLYERRIRVYYEEHDLDSPNKEYDSDTEL